MSPIRPAVLSTAFAAIAALSLSSALSAQERPYTEGSVWDVTTVRTSDGQYEAYLADLSRVWKKFNDEAMKKGLVKSYKILSAPAANGEDWDLLLLVEYPNMAVFDGMTEKMDPIAASILGNLEEQGQATVKRSQLRTITGSKLARELRFKT